MAEGLEHERNKAASSSKPQQAVGKNGGDHIRQAQKSGGGSQGSKGPVTAADKHNENSAAKS
jgi:hypothetical protein